MSPMTDATATQASDRLSWRPCTSHVLGWGVFAGSLLLYIFTMPPTIAYGGDCGDLISASHTLGICHPTGYPLYLLLGKLFACIFPFGDIAYRYNLLSALCAAGATSIVALTVHRMGGHIAGALFAAAMLAVSYLFWSQAIIAEVYSLNALFVTLLLYCFHRWAQEDGDHWLYLAGAALGFGLTNHLTMLLVGAALLAALALERRRLDIRRAAVFMLCAALPLLFYLYLPIRARANPHAYWTNPDTFGNFIGYVSGRLYREHMFGLPLSDLPRRLGGFLSLLGVQFLAGNIFALCGLVVMFRDRQPLRYLISFASLLTLIVYLPYDVADIWLFFLPLFVLWTYWMGAGVCEVTRRVTSTCTPVCIASLNTLLVFMIVVQAYAAYPRVNMRGHWFARNDAMEAIGATRGKGTILTGSDELLFSLWYLQKVERRGTQLQTIPMAYPEDQWESGDFQNAARRAMMAGPVYSSAWMPALQSEFDCVLKPMVIELRPCKRRADMLVHPSLVHCTGGQECPPSAAQRPLDYTFDANTEFPITKRGSLRLASIQWTLADGSTNPARARYRLRLFGASVDTSRQSNSSLPTDSQLTKLERTQPEEWTTRWTTTYLPPPLDASAEGSRRFGKVTVPVWVPPNVFALEYRLWGRVELLSAEADFDAPSIKKGPWEHMGTIKVIDK